MVCPGSQNLCDALGLKESPPNKFSAEGTFAHDIRAKCLTKARDPIDFVGVEAVHDGFSFKATIEMADHLRPGIERLREDVGLNGTLLVEQKYNLSAWMPGSWGTADAVITKGDLLIVDDLKYGMGIPVEAERNRQLMIYALRALVNHKAAKTVRLRIDQPRVAGGGSTWELPAEELRAFGDEVRAAAAATKVKDAPLVPSEKGCKWCPVAAQCPALAAQSLATVEFDNLGPVYLPPTALTPEQRSNILRNKAQIESWLDGLHTQALLDALSGREVPGFKAVEGRRGSRTWSDQGAVEIQTLLGDAAFERVLLSPAKVEKAKLIDKKALADLVTQAEGKPALVPENDKRPAITLASTEFELITSNPDAPWE